MSALVDDLPSDDTSSCHILKDLSSNIAMESCDGGSSDKDVKIVQQNSDNCTNTPCGNGFSSSSIEIDGSSDCVMNDRVPTLESNGVVKNCDDVDTGISLPVNHEETSVDIQNDNAELFPSEVAPLPDKEMIVREEEAIIAASESDEISSSTDENCVAETHIPAAGSKKIDSADDSSTVTIAGEDSEADSALPGTANSFCSVLDGNVFRSESIGTVEDCSDVDITASQAWQPVKSLEPDVKLENGDAENIPRENASPILDCDKRSFFPENSDDNSADNCQSIPGGSDGLVMEDPVQVSESPDDNNLVEMSKDANDLEDAEAQDGEEESVKDASKVMSSEIEVEARCDADDVHGVKDNYFASADSRLMPTNQDLEADIENDDSQTNVVHSVSGDRHVESSSEPKGTTDENGYPSSEETEIRSEVAASGEDDAGVLVSETIDACEHNGTTDENDGPSSEETVIRSEAEASGEDNAGVSVSETIDACEHKGTTDENGCPSAEEREIRSEVEGSGENDPGVLVSEIIDPCAQDGEEENSGEIVEKATKGSDETIVESSAGDDQPPSSYANERTIFFMIKLPRYIEDESFRASLNDAQLRVDEETQKRNAIQAQRQAAREKCREHSQVLKAARGAKGLLSAKRKEMDAFNSVMDKVKAASYVEEINDQIYNMERRMQHETLPLKEEKQLIRDIKQLKQEREQAASLASHAEIEEAIKQKTQAEESLKLLKKDAESLRKEVISAENAAKVAAQKHAEEQKTLKELDALYEKTNATRQEAYVRLHNLKKQAYEKRKLFLQYKGDAETARTLAFNGDKKALAIHCDEQAERIMQLWNDDAVFRNDYIRCNLRSTLWRFGTPDGRSLAPNETPAAIPSRNETATPLLPTEKPVAEDAVNVAAREEKPPVVETKNNNSTKNKKKGVEIEDYTPTEEKEKQSTVDNHKKEVITAAAQKEQRRIEERAKAQDAMERKRKLAERAKARAAFKAQKEAELKDKKRECKAKKKETITESESESVNNTVNAETSPATAEIKEREVKKPQKPKQLPKQNKSKSVPPPPLRHRGRRKLPTWMWLALVVPLVVVLLFLQFGYTPLVEKFRS